MTKRLVIGVWIAALLLAPVGAWAAGANTIADTYVSSTSPASNFGTATAINIGGGNTALIQFDLSGLPAGLAAANINKATMTFYVNTVAIAGAVDIAQVTSAWTETGVNNGNRPTFLSPFLLGVATTTSRQYVTVDVTQLVKDWVSGVAQNFGVQLSAAASASTTAIVLDSKENQTTSHPAFLDVVIQSVGPAGPSGPQGTAGAPGVTGPSGPQGTAGAAGPSGVAGPSGPVGNSGPAGPSGVAGPSGPLGPSGPVGNSGPAGPSGVAGPSGPVGNSGPAGPSGVAGPSGPLGPAGNSGPAGPSGVAGPSGPLGPAGASGPSGPQGTAGAAGPSGPLGPAGASGPSGPQGTAGAAGPSGPLGPAGASGPSGPQGTAGAAGPSGPLGPAGASGPSGPQGTAGAAGPSGPLGPAGATGPSGPQGNPGSPGAAGATGATGPQGANGAGVFGASTVNPSLTPPGPTIWYMSLNGDSVQTSNGQNFAGISMPVACTFERLSVTLAAVSGGATDNIAVTLVKNGADQSMTCTATSSSTASALTSCSSTTPITVAIGDIVGLHFSQSNSAPTVRIAVGTRCN